jgi:two-component system NtrC family sensor kinase
MSKRELILVALDPSPILKLMEPALHAAGYEVAVVHNDEGLSKALQESNPALVMIGESFDGKSGIEESKTMLERFPTLPIILYAEKDTTGIAKNALRAGISNYIYPPLKTTDIVEAVKASLARSRKLGDWLRREVKRTTSSLAEKAKISESERSRLEAVFANSQDGVIILDESRTILLINHTASRVFSIDEKKSLSKNVLDVITHPDIVSLLQRAEDDILKFHEVNFDDGQVFNAQFTPIPSIGFVITMQDITYLKEINRMKNEFINTVSHDLRSPLTAVLGYTELLSRVGDLNEVQTDFVHRLEEAVRHITALVNDLLDLSRMESGFDTRREPVHVETILDNTLTTLEGQAKQKRVAIHKKVDETMPQIHANPVRIRQMLDNLVGNAIKYAPDNGHVEIDLHSEDHQIILNIVDDGPGIPVSEQGKIFDKFYRATNAPKESVGTGLGLAIVKSIVDSHQGRVWVESAPGSGAAFFVVLPAHEENNAN